MILLSNYNNKRMTPEEIYEAVKDLTPYQTKKWYIDNKITEEQKIKYRTFKNVKKSFSIKRDKIK